MKKLLFKRRLTCMWRYSFSVVSACCSQNRQTAHTGCSSQSDQSLMNKSQKDSFSCGKRRDILRKGNSDSTFTTLEINLEKLNILKGWERQRGFIAGYMITICCRV